MVTAHEVPLNGEVFERNRTTSSKKVRDDPRLFGSEENESLEKSGSRVALKRVAKQATNTHALMPRWEAQAAANEKNCIGGEEDAEHLFRVVPCFQRCVMFPAVNCHSAEYRVPWQGVAGRGCHLRREH